MHADDTNLFSSHRDIKDLIETADNELQKLSEWYFGSKLSLNTDKHW